MNEFPRGRHRSGAGKFSPHRLTQRPDAPTGAVPPSYNGAVTVSGIAQFEIVALAASAGGLNALTHVLAALPADFPAALVVVQHLDRRHRSLMAQILGKRTALTVSEAAEGAAIVPGRAYIAPPDRHLLVNTDRTISLSRT